jgi:hypothetical protein
MKTTTQAEKFNPYKDMYRPALEALAHCFAQAASVGDDQALNYLFDSIDGICSEATKLFLEITSKEGNA